MCDGEEVFLFHFTPPLGLGAEPVLMLLEGAQAPRAIAIEAIGDLKRPVVTHSFSLLADWLRQRNVAPRGTVIDLECAQRLITGRRKGEVGPSKPWEMAEMWFRVLPTEYQTAEVRRALNAHFALPVAAPGDNQAWLEAAARVMPELWRHLKGELEEKQEWERYLAVEVPIYNQFIGSQIRGIAVDPAANAAALRAAEEEYLAAHHRLAIGMKLDVERALRDIEYLGSQLRQPIRASDEWMDARELVESRRGSDEVCELLHKVTRATLNRAILLRTSGAVTGDSRCYVQFDTMGTVTGRVLAVDPLLQQLSKRHRALLRADEGFELLYIDYANFEPCIMASLSGDETLLALCKGPDLYRRLAIDVCGTAEAREAMKLVFLAYSYGKNVGTLGELLVGVLGDRESADAAVRMRFAPLFKGVEAWKARIQAQLEDMGRVGTVFGNHRYRTHRGRLDAQEKRWAISQVVQGTGSLILKKVILALAEEVAEADVLLPMHDALLLQVPAPQAPSCRAKVLKCFQREFEAICPGVTPAVHDEAFAGA